MAEATGIESPNAAQIAYWNDNAGANWTRLQEKLDAMFAPIASIALDAAAPATGERVIDVGSGCGGTLLDLARRIGATGRATGLDVSEPMSARARDRLAAAGLSNAEVIVGDAASCPLPQGRADLLFSRFGVMFFDDPAAAFGHLRTLLRPGGRLLWVVWRGSADNPWFRVAIDSVRDLLPSQPAPEPDAPGPLALADPERTRALLGRAGWQAIELARHDVGMRVAPAGDLDAATEFAMEVGPLARMLAEAGPEIRPSVRSAVRQALQPYDTADGVVVTGSVWLVSART